MRFPRTAPPPPTSTHTSGRLQKSIPDVIRATFLSQRVGGATLRLRVCPVPVGPQMEAVDAAAASARSSGLNSGDLNMMMHSDSEDEEYECSPPRCDVAPSNMLELCKSLTKSRIIDSKPMWVAVNAVDRALFLPPELGPAAYTNCAVDAR